MSFFSIKQFTLPAIALLIANLFALYGVLRLEWGVFELVLLFWLENIVIGLFYILKIFLNRSKYAHIVIKLFYSAFFMVHYGMFTMVHGIFVMALFGPENLKSKIMGLGDFFIYSDLYMGKSMGIALSLLFISHAIALYYHYMRNDTFTQTGLKKLMFEPYSRIITLHIGIIASGFLLVALGEPMAGLVLVLFLKIGFDLRSRRAKSSSNSDADVARETGEY